MASAPVSESAPSTPRTRKSPRPCSGRFSSITRPISRPFSSSSALGQRQLLDDLLHALERRAPGELEHEVALGGRDHELGADRPRALRDDGAHSGRPSSTMPTTPSSAQPPFVNRRAAPRPPSPAKPPSTRHAAEARRRAARPASSEDRRARPRASRRAAPAVRRARGPRSPSPTCAWNGVTRAPAGSVAASSASAGPPCCSRPAPITPSAAHAPMIAASGARSAERLGQIVRRLAVLAPRRTARRDRATARARAPLAAHACCSAAGASASCESAARALTRPASSACARRCRRSRRGRSRSARGACARRAARD